MPTAEPRRLHAIARPTPHARTSVGKHSGGNTPTRFENADMVSVKMPNATIIASVADSGSTLKRDQRNARHRERADQEKHAADSLMVSQIPDQCAEHEKAVQQQIRAGIVVQVNRFQDGRQERANREVRNDETHEKRAVENRPANQVFFEERRMNPLAVAARVRRARRRAARFRQSASARPTSPPQRGPCRAASAATPACPCARPARSPLGIPAEASNQRHASGDASA